MRLFLLRITLGCALVWAPSCTSNDPVTPDARAGQAEIHPGADAASRDLAQREMVRREQAMQDALGLIEEGDRQRAAGNLEGATRTYQQSIEKLPR